MARYRMLAGYVLFDCIYPENKIACRVGWGAGVVRKQCEAFTKNGLPQVV